MFGDDIRPRYYAHRMQPEPTERVSVLIADDQRLVRTGFRVMLAEFEGGIEVAGTVADGARGGRARPRAGTDLTSC